LNGHQKKKLFFPGLVTRKNAQVVTNLQAATTCGHQLVPTTCGHLSTGCVRTACSQLVDKLSMTCYKVEFNGPTDVLQIVPTTCYCPAIQQFVNK
jgi:hypothetical protein